MALVAIAIFITAAAHGGPVLSLMDDRFAVNGEPRFLVLVAYFDGMRASDQSLDADFAELRSLGVDGIRLFPNWWNWADTKRFPDDTLMDGGGNLRPERLKKLRTVLEKAAAHELIVDVSFAYEIVSGISDLREDQLGVSQGLLPVNQVHIDDYENALMQAAKALGRYHHIFFDIQNEYNGRITHLSDGEVVLLRRAVKRIDPNRIVTASLANEITPEEAARKSEETGLNVIGFHDSRNPWRFDATDELVRRARQVSRLPIYFGEPAQMDDAFTVEHFVTAVTKAKEGGAAAWTFHTPRSFELGTGRLFDKLTEPEKTFLRVFRNAVNRTPWGNSDAKQRRP
ncbi:MAG: hypothetical protein AMXMBFR4_27420 [Candidatus Hydrogenedentota bacterium]